MIRIKYTISGDKSGAINASLADTLQHDIAAEGCFEVVDAAPEIVHVFGPWSGGSASLIKKYKKKGVPVVFTSIHGMAQLLSSRGEGTTPMATALAVRRICALCSVVHTCGPAEEQVVKAVCRRSNTVIIRNALLTSLTSQSSMIDEFAAMYNKAYARHDEQTRKDIAARVGKATTDPAVANICTHLMYLRHLYTAGCIPQRVLDAAARDMTTTNYDEKELAQVLETLKILDFSAYCMTLLQRNASLTEGFMPIKAKTGRTADNMQKMTVQ